MKVLLTIGYTEILLPDDTGIPTILKALSRGLVANDRLYDNKITVGDPLEVGMKYVGPQVKIIMKKKEKDPELLCLEAPKAIIPEPPLRASASPR